jgi:anti-sigma factor RsiW
MKSKSSCPSDRIHEYLDGRMSSGDSAAFESHLDECEQCRSVLNDLRQIDASLRAIPLEKTGNTFTRSVMEQLGIAPGTTVAFRVLEWVAYVFGLLVILALSLTVLVLTGAMKPEQIAEGQSAAADSAVRMGELVSSLADGLTGTLVQYFPFLFTNGSSTIALGVVLLVLALVAVDRLVMRRMLGR